MYPFLRDEIESILSFKLKQCEQRCKDHISLNTTFQLSYINTNHEEFIGFANAEQYSNTSSSSTTTTATTTNNSSLNTDLVRQSQVNNLVIRKGYLGLHLRGMMKASKDFWFSLTTDSLAWFKDHNETEKKYMVPLDGLMFRLNEPGVFSKRCSFALFYTSGKNVFKEHRELDLVCDTHDDLESWEASLYRAGVFPEKRPLPEKEIQETRLG